MVSVESEVTATFPEDWHANVPPGPPLELDRVHFAFPVSPLFASTMGPAFAVGATAAFRALDLPMHDMVVVVRNHYLFYRWATLPATTGPDDGADADQVPASVQREIGRMMERWLGEHRPRILDHLCRLEALDIATATPTEIGLRLDEAQAIHEDLWRIHFIVVEPAMYSLEQFDELFAGLFGEGTSGSHDLLVGGLSETLKAGIGLSDLAARVRELGLAELLLETPLDGLVGVLEESEVGRDFLDFLGTYLDAYGLRQNFFDYAAPTWREDPSTALTGIRNYLQSGRDARIEQEAIARSAEAALNTAREQLAGYPAPVRSQFEAMVQLGRDGAFLHEEHNYFIDQRGMALLRLFYLKVGQRFVDVGVFDAADDVFMLDIGELQRALDELSGAGASGSLRRLVAERRVELELAATMTPPAFIGEPTASSPAEGESSEPAEELTGLRGMGGAKGKVTGVARVARTLDEARKVQPGEILITISTLPPWTPLFGAVAAVVTETGGPLGHCAIVAREYGIPAVVGVSGATRAIATGMRVTVDGTSGLVTIDA